MMPTEAVSIKHPERLKSAKGDPSPLFTYNVGLRSSTKSYQEHEQMLIGVLGSKAVYQIYPGALSSATLES